MNKHVPKIGLVPLGCPKALVDSEQAVLQLGGVFYLAKFAQSCTLRVKD